MTVQLTRFLSTAEREALNDSDGTIVRFWRALRDHPEELAAAIAATPYSREEWRVALDCDVAGDIEAATLDPQMAMMGPVN